MIKTLRTHFLFFMVLLLPAALLKASPHKDGMPPGGTVTTQIRITEFMYDGNDNEFVEFTNVGDTAVDMTNWSFDDNHRTPGVVSLSGFGKVQPGESVILAQNNASDFRAEWNLCDNIKIVGGNTTNLGRSDEINLYDAGSNLIDRLTFGDQDFPGTIRTQNVSGYVTAAGLGANDISKWVLSVKGDAEDSYNSVDGDLGSPGKSTMAPVRYNPCGAPMRITEFMYDGSDNEFVEFTNVGDSTIDMTGWSYDDDGRTAGAVSLSAFGKVRAGESVILAQNSAADFRAAWGLCDSVKVIGSNTTNLGRSDEINLFDASGAWVDRLTYGDQTFPGTIRTQNKSGWVTAAGLGKNDISQWVLSSVGDAEGSYKSTGGDIGSPGKSTRATVSFSPCSPGAMRITEFMYDGNDLEFIEFTNVGSYPVNMKGWSFDDNHRTPGAVNLSGFDSVQPGESVVLAENTAAGFRTAWNLCNGVKVIGGNTANLGRADEINLYDSSNSLIDRLTYDDQSIKGSIRTQNVSGYVTADGLGKNDITKWVLSVVGDSEGSVKSKGGDIGSPGKSTRAIVAYNPCTAVVTGAPKININVDSTSNYLDGGLTTPPASPYAISGVINDPADPASVQGIYFTVRDSTVAAANLTLSVTSSNPAVVPNANLVISGKDSLRKLTITPVGVGYADITLKVSNGTDTGVYVINYAASVSSSKAIKWSTGMADASGAIALDSNYMVVVDDEDNLLYEYNRNASGLPVKTYDLNANNYLNLTDGSANNWKEVDIEATTWSASHAGRAYFLGSMSNSSSFNDKPDRNRIIAVDISGTGDTTAFSNAGYYANMRQQLITWGDANGYNFTASAAEGVDPKTIDGFNLEGMVFAPDNSTLYLGFRAPLVPTANRTKAVIAPIKGFENWFNGGVPSGNPLIGAPIELDLGGRGIRDIIRLSNGNYVIAAGSYDGTLNPALYRWTGNATDAPVLLTGFDLTGLNIEGLLQVNQGGQLADNKIQVICDNGDSVFYNDGTAAKDLAQDNFKKFISLVITSSTGAVLPVGIYNFTAQRIGANVQLNWQDGTPTNTVAYKVMRSINGVNFVQIATVAASAKQSAYAYVDVNTPAEKLYYSMQAVSTSGSTASSPVKVVAANNNTLVNVYPNPVTSGSFTIAANATGNKTVDVYNSTGALVTQLTFSDATKTVSTNGWAKGVYLLRIIAGNSVVTQKIIVQ